VKAANRKVDSFHALFVAVSVDDFDSAHRTDPFFVGTVLTVMSVLHSLASFAYLAYSNVGLTPGLFVVL